MERVIPSSLLIAVKKVLTPLVRRAIGQRWRFGVNDVGVLGV
jgi:hypothetical protein